MNLTVRQQNRTRILSGLTDKLSGVYFCLNPEPIILKWVQDLNEEFTTETCK